MASGGSGAVTGCSATGATSSSSTASIGSSAMGASATGSRLAGPSASCSRRATSPGSAPWRRLSSRWSLIASSRSPMARHTLAAAPASLHLRRGLCPHGAILARALGTVQRLVGRGDEPADVLGGTGQRRDAEARGDARVAAPPQQRQDELLDPRPHALGEIVGALEVGAGEDARELPPAVARRLVDL